MSRFITSNRKILVISLIFFTAGVISGYFIFRFGYQNKIFTGFTGSQLREKENDFTFIDPLVACISADKEIFDEFKPLEKEITSFVNEKIKSGEAEKISVYFRNLNDGHWTGVNENEKYFPASLLKVPVMMTYFKKAESEADFLDRIVYLPSAGEVKEGEIATSSKVQSGESYTFRELINYMIIDSDNAALSILVEFVDKNILSKIFSDLEISSPASLQENESYSISARQYSLLFRSLYNATILSRGMSEKALGLLSQVKFDDGFAAPLPASILVAHKYGLRIIQPAGIELHDCGIVYYPQKPYFLCVMTKGGKQSVLASIIANISDTVYKYVNQK